jgi:hypothetical protein
LKIYSDYNQSLIIGSLLAILTILLLVYVLVLNKNINKWTEKNYFLFAFTFSILFLSSFLLYGQINIEDYAEGMISAKTVIKYLFKGEILTWYDGRVFGSPFPIIATLDKHPLLYLTHFFPNRVFYSLFYLFHLTFGGFFFIRICNQLKFSPRLILVSGFLFIFSIKNVSEPLNNDWPTVFICFSMLPILFYYAINISKYTNNNKIIFFIPLLLSFVIYNGHPIDSIKHLFFISIFFFISIYHSRNHIKYKNIIIALILTIIIIFPRIYYVLNELSYFPDDLIPHSQSGYTLTAVRGIMNNLVPFWGMNEFLPKSNLFESIINSSSLLSTIKIIPENFAKHSTRTPFIGLPYIIISLIFFAFILRKKENNFISFIEKAIVVSFIFSMFIMHTPSSWYFDLVHPWTLRDLFIFFGILTGGLTVKLLESKISNNNMWIINLILFLQVFQHIGYVGNHVFFKIGNPRSYGKNQTNYFAAPNNDSRLVDWLNNNKNLYGKRILLSPLIELDLINEHVQLPMEKIYSIPEINYYTGINVINDYNLKNISLDVIQPAIIKTKGWVRAQNALFKRKEFLDISGIDWVIIKENELNLNIALSDLTPVDTFSFDWQEEKWIALQNEDVWGKEFLLSSEIMDYNPPKEYCKNNSLFCNDLSEIPKYHINSEVERNGVNGSYTFSFASSNKKTVLGISMMYRPEWIASSTDQMLNVFPLFDGFIGIEIPENTTEISLRFNDKLRKSLMLLSALTFCICIYGVFKYQTLFKKNQ